AEGAVLFLARKRVVVVVILVHTVILPAPCGAIVILHFYIVSRFGKKINRPDRNRAASPFFFRAATRLCLFFHNFAASP
ncbi:MAG: hypothetical protein J6P88_00035, partial [Clostridia bacterium]|nr:hypothetical protein [Clostridia bacterium]